MGRDRRGKDRGSCVTCDCSDYEAPIKGKNSKCSYCGCPPTRHRYAGDGGGGSGARPQTKEMWTDKTPSNQQGSSNFPDWPDLPSAGTFDHIPRQDSVKDSFKDYLKDNLKDDLKPGFQVESVTSSPLESKPGQSDSKPGQSDIKQDQSEASSKDQGNKSKVPDKERRRDGARAGPQQRRGNGATDPSFINRPNIPKKKKKSAAVKVHNLDQIMSSHLADKRTAEKIDMMFQSFDDDGSNELDKDECTNLTGYILQQCGLQPDIIPSFVYDEAFAHYDEDGGGTITLAEFREFLMSHLKK